LGYVGIPIPARSGNERAKVFGLSQRCSHKVGKKWIGGSNHGACLHSRSKILINLLYILNSMAELKAQPCPFCSEKKMTLREGDMDIPYFGKVFIFSMECEGCGIKKSDVEPAEQKEPCRYTLEVTSEEDLNIRVVKSGEATIKIPHVITIDPGPVSSGYVTNVEGLLEKVKEVIQGTIDVEEEDAAKKKAKNLVKKLNRAMAGQEPIKIIIEDPSGHSAIVSEKAQKGKL